MQQPPRKKTSKLAIGCILFIAVLLCGAVVSIGRSIAGDTGTPTPTDTVVAVSQVTPTLAPTTRPTPTPTHKAITQVQPTQPPPQPTPTRLACQAVNGNPWCYNFSPGGYITSPPSNFCDYFNCIASFWNGNGFVNECQDSTYSKSGGIQGDCSRHGGELRPLYSH